MKLRHYAVFIVFSAAVAGAVFWLSEAAKEKRIMALRGKRWVNETA